MDMEKKWGLGLTSIMFLTSSLVHCQNQTIISKNGTSITSTNSSTLEEIVPGSLKIGTDNLFAAPEIFGGEPFSLKTDPVTGEVDFQTRTVNVQTVNEERDKEEAQKVSELQEDLRTRVPSSASLPLEARDEEYGETWEEPIKRGDVEYYEDEQPEAREPIMVPQKGYTQRPTTPKEEESFMSIFESLFGGGEEQKKPEPLRNNPPFRQKYQTTPLYTTERIRTTMPSRYPEPTERRPSPTQPPRNNYQQYTEKYSNYKPPERQQPPYNPYQQINRPNSYQEQRIPEQAQNRPINPYREPERNTYLIPERPNIYDSKPVHENSEVHQVTPQKLNQKETEMPLSTPTTTQKTTTQYVEKTTYTTKPETKSTTEQPTTSTQKIDWNTIENNKIDSNSKENIDRQDTFQNEVNPTNSQNTPDYFNFINLPVHYSTKDTAIPLISTSYANTKVQGMGASKYEKNNGKYSNHKYDPSNTTTKRPSYWQSKRPSSPKPSFSNPVDFSSLEYDDTAIGSSADFGGYGHKEGVKVKDEPTQPPTRQTQPPTRATSPKTTTQTYRPTTSIKTTTTQVTRPTSTITPYRPIITTPFRPTVTKPAPVKEYDEYDYESYPAQVKPVASPSTTTTTAATTKTTTKRPIDTIPEDTKISTNKVGQGTKEPDYEYYDYDTETPSSSTTAQVTSTTTTSTTTTTRRPPSPSTTTTTQRYKFRYPSLSKDKIRRPDEKVEVVVPTKIEITTQQPTTSQKPIVSTNQIYYNRPTTTKDPAPVFEEEEEEEFEDNVVPTAPKKEDVRPIIVTAGKPLESDNVNIVLVPAKTKTTTEISRPTRLETQQPSRQPANDYTTEFTVGVVQGHPGGKHPGFPTHQGPSSGQQPGFPTNQAPSSGQQPGFPTNQGPSSGQHSGLPSNQGPSPGQHTGFPPNQRPSAGQHPGFPPSQGHYVASSIAASPFEGPDEPFRPIARPAGMSASFQVVGDTSDLENIPENIPERLHHTPSESEVHEPHEFIPSPQFHRPANNHFVVGTSFNARPPTKPAKPFENNNYNQNPANAPERNEVINSKPKPPPRPYYNPQQEEKPPQTTKKPYPPNREEFYKPPKKPQQQKPEEGEDEDYGWMDVKPNIKEQTNVEIGVDYDFDGIQTEPKPGQYVIFPKPQLNSEINENRVKAPNTGIPHFHEKPSTENTRTSESLSTTHLPERHVEEQEKQQVVATNYPRPHWEKNSKPSFLVNAPNNRNPSIPPQMSPNLGPPGNIPQKFRKPVAPSNLPPVRKTYNEGNFQSKPKQNLPNILPQFRPNAKVNGPPRPYRPMMPNRRKENFPYRIQNEPDALMHRDFEVEEEVIPKYITNRIRQPEYDQMMIQKRLGVAALPPAPRRVQRTPVTTLQMLQQTHGVKKQQVPPTREDIDPISPMVPPAYKPYKDTNKDVYVVYPVKTPFNSNIKIEDPDKIEYSYNQTFDQVPLLKPSKKKEKVKIDFPYGFVTPDIKTKGERKDIVASTDDSLVNSEKSVEVKPNIQDYMPIGVKTPSVKQETIDMSLHMQSNNQWNQVSNQEVITRNEDPQKVPPTQYHTLMKNSNASEFTLGAVMHTLPEQSRKGQVTSVNFNSENPRINRPELNVNERIANGKIVTVSMPLDVKEDKEPQNSFQAPFQASSSVHGSQGWNILENPDENNNRMENVTENSNSTFNIENFTPQLIGGFKPIYSSSEEAEN